ncbi:MAG: phytoene/squalene synthase family protein [Moorea sp. SIO1F2]|uniref:phytoene/squalene synthase family protein n=1 Tax=unclassified Moorena TaxID=2683338 RepID=UPI0013BDF724|nr:MULTISPECIES: phytoene/squalene synthase family protein [unclassified Moorena]NEO17867.1 phytoene/squalene synthase family protein [Moorena sp. SIO4A5]NEP25901.1 phytoene/squalene synthase family protein [Moorena sp. SIO3I6]NEQ59885.1 phytoene/squalene synthase family protein [Moorena sp. SIO4A1]NET82077.1 phytoene/squalene synthase family protein [Moorena sp. SIO1F2]
MTYKGSLEILKETSRTFYIPISTLPKDLQEAVASAYLCMRAIDEIEDHPQLGKSTKAALLRTISLNLQTMGSSYNASSTNSYTNDELLAVLSKYETLPEVTTRIGDWAILAPETIAPRIWEATSAMADRMAYWVECGWKIRTEGDLNGYTFSVAGSVGLLLSDLWAWYDGTQTNRHQAIGFGRGLQAVNILRNRTDDLTRHVDFFPQGWSSETMQRYARRNLSLADAYTNALPKGPARNFCQIPLALAHATLDVLALGQAKLSREAVIGIVEKLTVR